MEYGMGEVTQSVAAALGGGLVSAAKADVGLRREQQRRRRLVILAIMLLIPATFLWYRLLVGAPFNVFALPSLPDDWVIWILPIAIILAIGLAVSMPFLAGRSPHLTYRPEQIDITFDDVIGIGPIKEEVLRTLNTFLGYVTYKDQLGGTPRRGLMFEGPPGTGKTHMAKAMAREAGVPFLFVSGTSFQSMWYGATARKIRSFFKELRKAARTDGGAIGFIEEIDAIAATRGGMNFSPASRVFGEVDAFAIDRMQVDRMMSEGTGGVVNELLVQMQSFDDPPVGDRLHNWFVDRLNAFLPAHRQLKRRPAQYNNILLIAATNRADMLDPALMRPGRFARRLTFELPAKADRRALIDHFLSRKAHAPEMEGDHFRDQLAGQTFGYTPVMIEHLFDEALIHALRGGRDGMTWEDVQAARLTEEVGIKNPVPYTDRERRLVATHEAGHATVAYLTQTRRLEVLSIVKRAGSLGLLAHGDLDEEYNRTRTEIEALMDIAMGGMVAEELEFGEPSTGPAGDLASATNLACRLVGAAGMGSSLVSLAAANGGMFDSGDIVDRTLKDSRARPEVERVLAISKARARALVDANRHILHALRDALLERDELIGEEIYEVARSAGEPVRDVVVERRGEDRRRHDLLQEHREQVGAITVPYADMRASDAAATD
jgi:cell division protease FtsH